MDKIDVVGEGLAEKQAGPDQDSRRVWIVGLKRHDPCVRLQLERRRRNQGRDLVIDRIGRRRRAWKTVPTDRRRRQGIGYPAGQRRRGSSSTAGNGRASPSPGTR